MVRRDSRPRSCWLALALLGACGDPKAGLGWPRLAMTMSGGDEGARWSLVVDRDGRYVHESAGDNGRGTIHEELCTGQIDPARVQAWFERVAAVSTAPHDDEAYRQMERQHAPAKDRVPRERFSVVYELDRFERRMPPDLATYEPLRDEATAWFHGARHPRPDGERCKEWTRGR